MEKIALLSVYDKTGIVYFANGLNELGYTNVSTGGTYKAIHEVGIPVKLVEDLTGFPEILEGRVKTLHPKIHGGILAKRDSPSHMHQVEDYQIPLIDIVAVNLYPFEEKIMSNASLEECIENIDVGGHTMIRAAAKNYEDVIIVTNPEHYSIILEHLNKGEVPLEFRMKLAQEAFIHSARYDAIISNWFRQQRGDNSIPKHFVISFDLTDLKMRYGTNWNQTETGFFRRAGIDYGIPTIEQLTEDKTWKRITEKADFHGKALSFNNIFDVEIAIKTIEKAVNELGEGIYSIVIKHGNDCGNAQAHTIEEAVKLATSGDPISAFGGIRATYGILNKEAAEHIKEVFTEIVIANDYTPEALEVLLKKKNIRILRHFEDKGNDRFQYKTGTDLSYLMLENKVSDLVHPELLKTLEDENYVLPEEFQGKLGMVAGDPDFYRNNEYLIHFGIVTCKNKFSNAITLVEEIRDGVYRQTGFGAGNANRVLSVKEACELAQQNFENEYEILLKDDNQKKKRLAEYFGTSVKIFEEDDAGLKKKLQSSYVKKKMKDLILISDSFFPFADNIEAAHKYGIRNIVVNGGSNRDAEIIAKAKECGMNMLFTGVRYFRH